MAEWRDGMTIKYLDDKLQIKYRYKILKIIKRIPGLVYADYWCYMTKRQYEDGMFYIDEFVIESWPAIKDVAEFNLDV